ncbi:hypothetical protein TSUD_234380 [Trifolium subterraneum]|uniref:Uncharacterized protein n=1 Tax=Trifolium subterraneum TaxID=3900 RepID=A0A2Z6LUT2_TRISU|nr:hypothetical protein TSUD_234380 [Trifolium subterraneum]
MIMFCFMYPVPCQIPIKSGNEKYPTPVSDVSGVSGVRHVKTVNNVVRSVVAFVLIGLVVDQL